MLSDPEACIELGIGRSQYRALMSIADKLVSYKVATTPLRPALTQAGTTALRHSRFPLRLLVCLTLGLTQVSPTAFSLTLTCTERGPGKCAVLTLQKDGSASYRRGQWHLRPPQGVSRLVALCRPMRARRCSQKVCAWHPGGGEEMGSRALRVGRR